MTTPAARLKAMGLAYLRFGRRMPIVCTEVGRWNADILGVSTLDAIEIEVKCSRADLKAEFKNKTAKHFLYSNSSSNTTCPSYFYFLVPERLKDFALELLAETSPKAGLLVCDAESEQYHKDTISVVKKATRITKQKPSQHLVATAMARCSSELCGLYAKNNRLAKSVSEAIQKFQSDLAAVTARTFGTLDYEDTEKDLEQRAAELAFCVDGIDKEAWERLAGIDKVKWLEAARKWLKAQYVLMEGWKDETFLF